MSGDVRSTAALSAALKDVKPRPFSGALYRFIATRFIGSPLSSAGSLKRGGRFNPPESFEALYTALSAQTAMAEREGLLLTAPGVQLSTQVGTGILLRLRCQLSAVVDLTDEKVRNTMGASLAMLLAPWLPWNVRDDEDERDTDSRYAPTQRIGLAAHASKRVEAILTPSSKDPAGSCLVVFPQRLKRGSVVDVDDPRGSIRAALAI